MSERGANKFLLVQEVRIEKDREEQRLEDFLVNLWAFNVFP